MSSVLAELDLLHGELPVVGIVGLAVLVRSTFGFGDALVAMPLLLLVIDDQVSAVALVALVSLVTAAAIFAIDHRRLSLASDAWVLSAAAVPGLLAGLWFLRAASSPLLFAVLGATVVVVGLLGLFCDPQRWRVPVGSAAGLGLLAGFLGGAFNVHGPPLVVYGTSRDWSPERFRATLQAYFLAAGVLLVGGHAIGGHYSRELFERFLACLPAVIVASWLGGVLNRRLPVERFRRAVHAILVVLGLVIFLGSIRG